MAKSETVGREVFTPIESFSTEVDGVPHTFKPGADFIREGSEVYEQFKHLLKPIHVQWDVEAATANPGELRQR